MNSNLYLLQFNNYYNRKVITFPGLSAYTEYACKGILSQNPIPNVNFIPNDGITTTQVINWDGETPDYVVVCEDNTIISRWFVIESVRLLTGQFKITLYRDTVADYYNDIVNAPMFIEKGWVSIDDPAIHNMESITTNQIKNSEMLLKDNTKTAWIVGYCDESDSGVTGEEIKFGGIPIPDFVEPDIDSWDYASLLESENTIVNRNSIKFSVSYESDRDGYTTYFNSETMLQTITEEDVSSGLELKANKQASEIICSPNTITTAINQFSIPVRTDYGNILRLNNKVLKVGARYYRIHLSDPYASEAKRQISIDTNTGAALVNDIGSLFDGTAGDTAFNCYWNVNVFSMNLIEITVTEGYTLHLKASRPVLEDAPYCMFCIPYGNYTITKDGTTFTVDQSNAFYLANGIATSLDAKLYDIQLLPYCPIGLLRNNGNSIDLDENTDLITTIHTESRTAIFYCTSSSGSFNITSNYKIDQNSLSFKVGQQTTMMRLCSPNYNGVFEFNPFYNKGIAYINVDYTYKPFQPYIHLNPNFKNLYGKDFNDARGLICGGEFSLPIITEPWKNYEIQNKNYQNMFNRQIENMETTQRINKKLEEWQAWTGMAQGALGGATSGMYMGGGPGAVAGAAVGGFASYKAGQADIKYNDMLRSEAIDYTKDNFGYQLDNIKALPNSLTRVSAYNANNKIFPFLEIYKCTEIERQAVKNKILYNGMTIQRIGTIKEFLPYLPEGQFCFFKGQIIRFDDIGDDFHVANVIASELNKGVYII